MSILKSLFPHSSDHKQDAGVVHDAHFGTEPVLTQPLPMISPIQCLQDLEILRTLGTGSFGRVHLVRNRMSGEFLAMKVLKKAEIIRLKQVEHTLNEKQLLSMIHHPFIVNLYGSFKDSTNLYMVMEYVQGGELFTHLRRAQVLSFSSHS